MKATREWLDGLKPGDKVMIVSGRHSYLRVREVASVTATQLTLADDGKRKFRMSDGAAIGNWGTWTPLTRVEPVDLDRLDAQAERAERFWLEEEIERAAKSTTLPMGDLRKAARLLGVEIATPRKDWA